MLHPARWRGPVERALRLGREHWFVGFLRDILLFLALAVTAASLDSRQAVAALWWPLPLALAAASLTLYLHGRPFLRWTHLAGLGLVFVPLTVRALLSLTGPLPALGLGEARELAVIFFAATALWLMASLHPIRALALWLGALGFGWLTHLLALWGNAKPHPGLLIGATPPPPPPAFWASPALFVCTLAVAWGLFALLAILLASRALRVRLLPRSIFPTRHGRVHYGFADYLNYGFFAAGLVLGWICFQRQTGGSIELRLALEASLSAQQMLWLKSLLLGWGHGTLDRLIEVLTEPRPATTLAWGGPVGTLALGGALGVMLLGLWSSLIWRRGRELIARQMNELNVEDRSWGILVLLATPAVLFWIGLMAGGGPRSALVLFGLAGWAALALVVPPLHRAGDVWPATYWRQAWRALPLALTGLIALILIVSLGVLSAGHSLAARPPADPARTRDRLYKAMDINRIDPAIPLALASTLRNKTPDEDWTPLLYDRVVNLYRQAETLDPLDPFIPLSLAHLQLQGEHPDEALATLRTALARRPNSLDLMNMAFLVAMRFKDTALAGQMLDRGLQLDPHDGLWWVRQYQLARQLGQAPLARLSLAAALTADPENPELIQALWRLSTTPDADPALREEKLAP